MFPTFLAIVPPTSANATAKNIGVSASLVSTHEHVFPTWLAFLAFSITLHCRVYTCIWGTPGLEPAGGWERLHSRWLRPEEAPPAEGFQVEWQGRAEWV